MGSRREEERNEKIIRGLMKLPPNRRCINCNSLGPQYVCTNFWTFVCMICSGIHREFTHRVKSVSMSKFTSQEVDALQAGGNQRAREIYLKSWDLQRQRLPDNSNVEKVREFIKNVYVEKKFAGGSIPSKPPRDLQSIRSLDNETRRASSYHSYSQSPPYDFQYEDRIYGKHGATLPRKPGSDRGIYVGKMSSYICSPTRFNEDGFANEGSVPRFSDYSASSVGDPFSSGAVSPSFQKDIGCVSLSPVQRLKDTLAEGRALNLFAEAKTKRDTKIIHSPQRIMSSGSVGTLSINSGSSNHEPEIDAVCQLGNMAISLPSAASWTNSTVDLFETPVGPPSDAHAIATIDLFQLPGAPPPLSSKLFQAVPQSQVSSTDVCSPSQTSVPSSSGPFCGGLWQPLVSPFNKESVAEPLGPVNEGWANFDSSPPATSVQGPQNLTTALLPIGSSVAFDITSAQTMEMQWPQQHSFCPPESSVLFDSWKEPLQNFPPPIGPIDTQSWNAFDDHSTMLPLSIRPIGELQSAPDESMPVANQHSVNLALQENTDNVPKDAAYEEFEFPVHAVNVEFSLGAAYMNPLMKNSQSDAASHKSANPFDLPFDSDLEAEHMFLDMSSLQAALPKSQLPATFLDNVNQQWFPPDPVPSYIQTAAAQGGLAYMAGQAPTTKLGNIKPEGPAASIGRNPFD